MMTKIFATLKKPTKVFQIGDEDLVPKSLNDDDDDDDRFF